MLSNGRGLFSMGGDSKEVYPLHSQTEDKNIAVKCSRNIFVKHSKMLWFTNERSRGLWSITPLLLFCIDNSTLFKNISIFLASTLLYELFKEKNKFVTVEVKPHTTVAEVNTESLLIEQSSAAKQNIGFFQVHWFGNPNKQVNKYIKINTNTHKDTWLCLTRFWNPRMIYDSSTDLWFLSSSYHWLIWVFILAI